MSLNTRSNEQTTAMLMIDNPRASNSRKLLSHSDQYDHYINYSGNDTVRMTGQGYNMIWWIINDARCKT